MLYGGHYKKFLKEKEKAKEKAKEKVCKSRMKKRGHERNMEFHLINVNTSFWIYVTFAFEGQ